MLRFASPEALTNYICFVLKNRKFNSMLTEFCIYMCVINRSRIDTNCRCDCREAKIAAAAATQP